MTFLESFSKLMYVDINYDLPPVLQNTKSNYFSYKIPCFSVIDALKVIRDIYKLDVNKITSISVYSLTRQNGRTTYVFKKKHDVDSDQLRNLIITLKKFHK